MRGFLVDVASGDADRPLRKDDLDWEKVFEALRRHGLVGLAQAYLRHQASCDYPPRAFRAKVGLAFALSTLELAAKYRSITKLLALLADSSIDYMVVKGLAVAHTVYPTRDLRAFGDVDLVVRERDWTRVHRLLVEHGFVAVDATPAPPPKILDEAVIQEQQYWGLEESLLVEIHYDDVLYAGLAARDVEGFWRRARWIDVEGIAVKVMSAEDQLVHLCAHLHHDSAARLIWFSDIAFIVRDQGRHLDWQRVLEIARVEEVQVPVYYSLYYVSRLLGVEPPAGVLAALRPDRFRRWWHERYLPEARVLSLEPMPRPSASFYFIPLFKRLLPDLLMMGRRKDKLRYLGRLLVPPRSWLRHYYCLEAGQSVGVHYVLHPLKLTFHYVGELATALSYLWQEKRGRRDWAWWCFEPRE